MQNLQLFLESSGMSEQDIELLKKYFYKKDFQKEDLFVREGSTNTHLGLIEKGIFQYFYNQDGNEVTTYVASEGNVLVSLASFLRQIPSKENIRALTQAQIWLINKQDFDDFRKITPVFNEFYIQMLEYQIVCIDESRHTMLQLSAEERYLKLLTEEPHLLQQIPLQYLASVLGVTPRHLSRIRKNIR